MVRPLLAAVFVAASAFADPRLDQYGDPLPEGAVARFGTVRYRMGSSRTLWSWVIAPVGKSVAAEDRDGIAIWDVETGKAKVLSPPLTSSAGTSKFDLCYSPDGKYLARLIDQSITIFDVANGKQVSTRDLNGRSVSILPGQDRLAFSSAENGRLASLSVTKSPVWKLSPSGRCYLVRHTTSLELIDSRTAASVCHFPDAKIEPSTDAAISWDDSKLYVAPSDGRLLIFDASSGKKLNEVAAPPGFEKRDGRPDITLSPDGSVTLSPDGSRAFISHYGQPTRQFDLKKNRWMEPLRTFGGPLRSIANGKRLLEVGSDGVIRQYDIATCKPVEAPFGFEDSLFTATSPDGSRVLAAYEDSSGKRLVMFDANARMLWKVTIDEWPSRQWSPDSKRLVLAGKERIVIRNAATGKIERTVRTADESAICNCGMISLDGRRVFAVLNFGRLISTYDLATGKCVGTIATGGRVANDSAPDGRSLLIDSEERGIALFDLEERRTRTGWRAREDASMGGMLGRALISPDGSLVFAMETSTGLIARRLGADLEDPLAVIRDAGNLQRKHSFKIQGKETSEFAFSPNGQWLATGDHAGVVRLWDVASGVKLGEWKGHRDYITNIGFMGPGRILSSSGDLTALLWDLRPKGRPTRPLWDALFGDDAAETYRAIWALADDPATPGLFHTKIHAVNPPVAEQVKRWLADLDAGRYPVREKATIELQRYGRLIEPALRATYARTTSEEARTRLEGLLAKLSRTRSGQEITQARAVMALELAGTEPAKTLLRGWAAGADGAWLTIDARAALSRLAAR